MSNFFKTAYYPYCKIIIDEPMMATKSTASLIQSYK